MANSIKIPWQIIKNPEQRKGAIYGGVAQVNQHAQQQISDTQQMKFMFFN